MPTFVTHAVAAAALSTAFPASVVSRRVIAIGAICAMVPDLDVIGFGFGIHYGDLLGHRGLSHSILFAFGLSLVATVAFAQSLRTLRERILICLFLFLATTSHGVLDAFTDGGLGIAFFSPFDLTRYFFLTRPIEVSSIGAGFFSMRSLSVLRSELIWVWVPCLAFCGLALVVRRSFGSRPTN